MKLYQEPQIIQARKVIELIMNQQFFLLPKIKRKKMKISKDNKHNLSFNLKMD